VSIAVVGSSGWFWYFSRASGLVSLVLLTTIVVLGVLGPLRVSSERWPRFAIRTVHRDVSLIAVVVILMHVVTITFDTFVNVPLTSLVLPWGSSYAPFWVGLGAVAFDLLLAIVITSLIRARLGYRTWRFVHWFAYVSWPVAVAHGLAAGSDHNAAWALALVIACIAVVVATVAMRVQYGTAANTLEA
jgi:predicted ferric reductase